MEYFLPLLTSFLFSVVLTKIIISSRDSWRWLVQKPQEDRWHRVPTPSLGGVAIFLAYLISFWGFRLYESPDHLKLLAGGSLVFLLGFWDDIRPLPPYAKLIAQIAIACLMVVMGIHALLTWNPIIYIPLTLVWIVGITNAFNLLDNMDGMAGGIALISALFLGILATQTQGALSPFAISAFVGSILGFLLFNLHPAKIFMGDCGSQWLGFMLACFAILDTWKGASNLFLMLATPVLVLAVPIFDTTLVALNRKIHGRPMSKGGRDHTSHRLVALGFSERKTVFVLWGLAATFGLVALFAQLYEVETWFLLVSAGLIFVLVFGIFLTDVKVYDDSKLDPEKRWRLPAFNILYKRRITEILIDALLIGGTYILAYLLRFDWTLDKYTLDLMERTLPLVVGLKLILMMIFGLYRGIWTYIDFESVFRLFRISFIASFGTVLFIVGVYRFEGFSRTIFAIDFVLLFFFMAGARALLRALRESVFAFPESGVRLLMIGAGDTGRYILREIRQNRQWNLRPVAIVDDDSRKQGKSIMGIPVVGSRDSIGSVVLEQKIDHVVMAIPSAKAKDRRAIEEICRESGAPFTEIRPLEETLVRQIIG